MLVTQIVFDDFTDIDVFLAWDLLNRVHRPDWQVRLLGTRPHHVSRAGLSIAMHGDIEQATHADAVLFASGAATRTLYKDAAYLARFSLDPARQRIGAVCSGALLLAGLGLLRGKRATTYPTTTALLADEGVDVVDQAFVCDGNIATAAACLAGVDLAGWVIASLLGDAQRDAVLAQVQRVGSA